MGKYQKNIEAARSVTIMQYLATCHPGELVPLTLTMSIARKRIVAL